MSAIATLDECCKNPRRADPVAVRAAWAEISNGMCEKEMVRFLCLFLRNTGVHFFPKASAGTILRHIEWYGTPDDSEPLHEDFDPEKHCLLCTEGSWLSHLYGDDMGPEAVLIAPHTKLTLLWWGCV